MGDLSLKVFRELIAVAVIRQTYRVTLWTVISRGSLSTGRSSGARRAGLSLLASLAFRSLQQWEGRHSLQRLHGFPVGVAGVQTLTRGQRRPEEIGSRVSVAGRQPLMTNTNDVK